MAQVTLTVNGRNYEVACGDGEEARLSALAAEIDDRVKDLAKAVGQVGEARLLLLAALLLADELQEGGKKSGNGAAQPDRPKLKELAAREEAVAAEAKRLSDVAHRLDSYAERLETIAERLADA